MALLMSPAVGCGATSSSEREPEGGLPSPPGAVLDGGSIIPPLDAAMAESPVAPADARAPERQLDAGHGHDFAATNPTDGSNAETSSAQVDAPAPSPSDPAVMQTVPRCGDGAVTLEEQCDDGNLASGDGCSELCRVELGKKCDGEPSVCVDTTCGDGLIEGAESCDDGNTAPFDGCSSRCLNEPSCEGGACTSVCGDGLVIDEACDDGNADGGDGCSAECQLEPGFSCSPVCEQVNGQCVLRVPALFRDFAGTQPDFGNAATDVSCGIPEGEPIVPAIAGAELDAEGRPVLSKPTPEACIDSAESFARWFREGVIKAGEFTLYDNGLGGYVNRFGANGEQLVVSERTSQETRVNNATSPETCEPGCRDGVRSGLQCDNVCRPQHDAARDAQDVVTQQETQLAQARSDLEREQAADVPNETRIATLTELLETLSATVDLAEADVETLEAAADVCDAECQTDFDGQVAACVADCKPCSDNSGQYCTGGTLAYYDGTPLFFPVDDIMGETRTEGEARLPYHSPGSWPSEESIFGTAVVHNFSFTTEVRHWFRYEANTNLQLAFTADDDMWVFVNGKLAVDLGGIHVPIDGEVTINAQSADNWGLQPGKVYPIVVFQAERKMSGSTIRITFPPFDVTPSQCVRVAR